jgi:hypothetical protein
MPFTIACPTCKTRLNSAMALELGRSVTCPMCKSEFKVTANNQFESTRGQPAVTAAKTAASANDKVPPATNRGGNETYRGGDNPAVAEERPDDRSENQDGTNARPPAQADGAPGEQRQRNQRPRRAKKDKKLKSRRRLYIAIGAALVIVAGLLLWFFSGSDNYDNQMIAYLPDDVEDISGFEFDSYFSEASENEQGSVSLHPGLGLLREAGLKGGDIKRILFGTGKTSGQIMVVRLKKDVEEDALKQNGIDMDENGKKYFKYNSTGDSVYLASPRLLVFTRIEETMKGILGREEGKAVIAENLQEIAKVASEGHEWKVSIAGMRNVFGWLLGEDEKNVKAFGSYNRLSGRSVQTTNLFLFDNPEKASAVESAGGKRLDKRKEEVRDGVYKEMKSMNKKQKDAFREQVPTERVGSIDSVLTFSMNTHVAPNMLAPITIAFPGAETKPGFPKLK